MKKAVCNNCIYSEIVIEVVQRPYKGDYRSPKPWQPKIEENIFCSHAHIFRMVRYPYRKCKFKVEKPKRTIDGY